MVIAFRKKCAGIAYSSIGEILATDVGKMDLARIHETEILSHIVAIIVNIAIVIIAIVTIAIVTIAIVNIPIVIIVIVAKATAAAAVGKMELARTHGTEIPEGWALDKWAFFHTDKDKQVGFFTIRERQRHLAYVSYHHPHDNHHLNHHHHPLSSSC